VAQVEELPVLILVHIVLTGQLDGLTRLSNRWERSVCVAKGIGDLAVREQICSTGRRTCQATGPRLRGSPDAAPALRIAWAIWRAEKQRIAQAGGAMHNARHAVKVIGPDSPQRQPRLNHYALCYQQTAGKPHVRGMYCDVGRMEGKSVE
jgi:hypothetical protein